MAEYRGADLDEKLSIQAVIDRKVEPCKEIIDASEIDEAAVLDAIATYKKNISNYVKNGSGYIDSIRATLEATNSNRFYNGDEAATRISDLNLAKDNLANMEENNSLINEEEISSTIKKYNEELKNLKKGAKLKLLRIAADEYNAENSNDSTAHIKNTSTSQQRFDYLGERQDYTDHGVRTQSIIKISDINEEGIATYKYVYYDYINYWGIIKGNWWPATILDDDVDALEKKLKERNRMPY